jgi:beta-barrel assembly-enhancing protease
MPAAREQALWAAAEREEKALVARVRLYDDAQLLEYLTRIGARLVPEGVKAAGGPTFTVTVISDPTLNAFAMPDGHIYVHTGLLSRLENEAQLATVLAHETVHVTHRHALGFTRHAGEAGLAARRAGGDGRHRGRDLRGTVLSRTASVISGLGLELAAAASMTGFGRDLEGEADREGMRRLVAAGYDPKEAPRAFQGLAGDAADRGTLETFFLGNRARLEERVESAQALLASVYVAEAARPDTIKSTDEFGLRMRPVVRENAQLDIRAGRFALAQRQLDRVLAASPTDPIAHVYYGDLYRLQAQRTVSATAAPELDAKALASYQRAATLDPGYADPYRQLGLLYYGEKDTARAREAFQRYLALKPDAPDAARVRDYLVDLER